MEKNIFIEIEYAGQRYVGWQRQKNGISIQEEIEYAIYRLTKQRISIHGSGRTDSGVNALGQCASFKIDSTIPADRFHLALNSLLPEDIRILHSFEVDMDFHARYSAVGKHYRYTILNRESPSAIYNHSTCHIKHPLDVDMMRKASGMFVGKKDFSAFMSTGSSIKNTVRTIHTLQVEKQGDMIFIDIEGDGFLYNMVRIIAGTLADIGRGSILPDQIPHIIMSKDRSLAGPTLKAEGLCLVKVYY